MGDLDRTVHLLDDWFQGDVAALEELLRENLSWMHLYARRELDPAIRKRLDSVDRRLDAPLKKPRFGSGFASSAVTSPIGRRP